MELAQDDESSDDAETSDDAGAEDHEAEGEEGSQRASEAVAEEVVPQPLPAARPEDETDSDDSDSSETNEDEEGGSPEKKDEEHGEEKRCNMEKKDDHRTEEEHEEESRCNMEKEDDHRKEDEHTQMEKKDVQETQESQETSESDSSESEQPKEENDDTAGIPKDLDKQEAPSAESAKGNEKVSSEENKDGNETEQKGNERLGLFWTTVEVPNTENPEEIQENGESEDSDDSNDSTVETPTSTDSDSTTDSSICSDFESMSSDEWDRNQIEMKKKYEAQEEKEFEKWQKQNAEAAQKMLLEKKQQQEAKEKEDKRKGAKKKNNEQLKLEQAAKEAGSFAELESVGLEDFWHFCRNQNPDQTTEEALKPHTRLGVECQIKNPHRMSDTFLAGLLHKAAVKEEKTKPKRMKTSRTQEEEKEGDRVDIEAALDEMVEKPEPPLKRHRTKSSSRPSAMFNWPCYWILFDHISSVTYVNRSHFDFYPRQPVWFPGLAEEVPSSASVAAASSAQQAKEQAPGLEAGNASGFDLVMWPVKYVYSEK